MVQHTWLNRKVEELALVALDSPFPELAEVSIDRSEFGRPRRRSFPDFRSHFGRSLHRTVQLAEVPRTEAARRICFLREDGPTSFTKVGRDRSAEWMRFRR